MDKAEVAADAILERIAHPACRAPPMKDRIEFEDDGRGGRSEFRSRALFEIGLWAYSSSAP